MEYTATMDKVSEVDNIDGQEIRWWGTDNGRRQ